ncbi:hypothetical protein [Companilactobacillus heilongjiangensis]|nr:hypothetical protein [Companilactobacillus heilongjiangensis]
MKLPIITSTDSSNRLLLDQTSSEVKPSKIRKTAAITPMIVLNKNP